jgi:RHS repeat-associated protein
MTPGSGSALSYGFDASGNPTTLPTAATGSYDNSSELTSSVLSGATTIYTYNADGQRIQAAQSSTTIMSASYNGARRLTTYSNSAANMSSASYDGNGLRQSETTTPSGGSAITENFTWNPTASVPQVLMDSDNAYVYGAGNAPPEQVNLSSGTITYLVTDLLGSVRGIVSSSGSLTASTGYDAWGNPETTSGLTTYTPFGYASGYTDATGLSYLINRYYDPQTGQFLNLDSLADLTERPYIYSGDDPVNLVDPSGQCAASAATLDPGQSGCGAIWQKLLTRAFANKRTTGNVGPHGAFTRYEELLRLGLDPRHVGAFLQSRKSLQKTLAEFRQQKCQPPDGQGDLLWYMKRISTLPAPTPAQVKAYQQGRADAGGGTPSFDLSGHTPTVRFGSSPNTIVVLP